MLRISTDAFLSEELFGEGASSANDVTAPRFSLAQELWSTHIQSPGCVSSRLKPAMPADVKKRWLVYESTNILMQLSLSLFGGTWDASKMPDANQTKHAYLGSSGICVPVLTQ
jgi:hypothetical protein